MNPLIGVLGVCHKDIESEAYLRWLTHALDMGTPLNRLVFFFTQRAWDMFTPHGTTPFQCFRLHDECESGYPKSASHLFQRSLEWMEKIHPESPILWLECDAIPTHRGWLEAIEAEYRTSTAPFMGHLEHHVRPAHMAGCGVYPPNWRQIAPSIARCVDAPDDNWGHGKGAAFDTFCAAEIYPQAVQAATIKQHWNCPPFTRGMLPMIEGVSLFHPSKDGRLIALLNGTSKDPIPIDLVYPVKAQGWWENELRWSLRSIEKHAGHLVRDVYVIGDVPYWYKGKTIPFESIPGDSPNADQLRKLFTAAKHPGLTDDFVWMNNDFYCQHEPDLSMRTHMLGKPTQVRMPNYRKYYENAIAILKWNKAEHDKDFELHAPMPMNKGLVQKMEAITPFGDVAFRTLYGNLFHHDSVPMKDGKMRNWRTPPDGTQTWFSTDDSIFEARGSDFAMHMELTYVNPSRWEQL